MGCKNSKSTPNDIHSDVITDLPFKNRLAKNVKTSLDTDEKKRILPIETDDSDSVIPLNKDQNIYKNPSYHFKKTFENFRVNLDLNSERKQNNNQKMIGDLQIHSKYDLTEEILGTGVSGFVRIGLNRFTGKKYAIKSLVLESASFKKNKMLHNEVEIYLKLDHPSIAKLVEVYEDKKKIYLVMELCMGNELYERLADKKRYSERDVKIVAIQMLEAINYCHNKKVCHRDLKLENWVYKKHDKSIIRLIDFGFSRLFNSIVPMTAMHGTIYYVSPEVMEGCYREKCDIWSIGVIIYMLLAGTPPFNSAIDYEILLKIRNASFDFKANVWKDISDNAKNFICQLLSKNSDQRPCASQALLHPWLKSFNSLDIYVPEFYTKPEKITEAQITSISSIYHFAHQCSKFAKIIAYLIALTDTTNESSEYIFRTYDSKREGAISIETFSKNYFKWYYLRDKKFKNISTSKIHYSQFSDTQQKNKYRKQVQEEAKNIFNLINITKKPCITYSLFVAALEHERYFAKELTISKIFDKLADERHVITATSLQKNLGDSLSEKEIVELISPNVDVRFQDYKKILGVD